MKLSIGLGSKTGASIDIGSSSIKILKMSKSGNKYYAENLDVIALSEGSVSGGIINDAASIASYIKSSLLRVGIKDKNVVIAVPCKHVIIKTIEIPKMKESELASSIYYEAQQYINYDINDVFYDYFVLGDSVSDPNNYSVMIVAGKKDIIEGYINLIHECGLNPFIVDVDCIAIENMFNFNYPEESNEIIGIVRVGASETNVHIINKGVNLFRRDIPIGGVNISGEISKKFQISFNEAENIKIGASINNDPNFEANYSVYLNMILSRITSEIQRTIDYYAANNDKQYPKKIYITGGSSVLTGLKDDIESKLNIPIEILNPFRNILFSGGDKINKDALENSSHFFGIAVGLALRGLEKS